MAVDKLVDSTVLDGYFTDIANAIRGKNGSSDTYTPTQMPAAITAIPSGGGDTLYEAYNTTGYTYESDSTAFAAYILYNSIVKSIDLPNCTRVGNYACNASKSLISANLPETTNIGTNAFYNCTALTTIQAPKLATLGYAAFYSCRALRYADFPALSGILGVNTFQNCNALLRVQLGDITEVRTNVFNGCSACLEYDFSRCTSVPTLANINAFNNINANAVIKVPASLESRWKNANNWSEYEDYIVGV